MAPFGSHHDDAPLIPVTPIHPALASLEALQHASLRDLAVATLSAGVAPGPGEDGSTITDGDIYDRVKAAVCAAQGLPGKPGDEFDHGSGDIVMEGLQVLEHSLLVRLRPMGSAMVVQVNRLGVEAISSADPAKYVTAAT
jgi:hypothetical protein